MPVDTSHLWKQIRLGEDTDLELKEVQFQGRRISAPHCRDLADEFAAFANARGGSLVLGVADDRTPQVLTPEQLDMSMDVVSAICADSIEPALDYDAYRVPCREGGAWHA